MTDKTERGSREAWLNAAHNALVEGGVEAVKIMPLAQQLNLSRTSFYWFFKDREALLKELRENWKARTTEPLAKSTLTYAETETEAMLNVIGCFLNDQSFDARFEFAVRSWALQDAQTMEQLQAADVERLTALRTMLMRWGHDEQDADVRARTIYLVQIGYISMQVQETLDTRMSRLSNYVEIFTGKTPDAREIARLRAGLIG
ncbi:TetR/AcrR family transcriptional regulator [Celeribacter sp. ULVN23_4]